MPTRPSLRAIVAVDPDVLVAQVAAPCRGLGAPIPGGASAQVDEYRRLLGPEDELGLLLVERDPRPVRADLDVAARALEGEMHLRGIEGRGRIAEGAEHAAPIRVGAEEGRLDQARGDDRFRESLRLSLVGSAGDHTLDELGGSLAVAGYHPGHLGVQVVESLREGAEVGTALRYRLVAGHAVGEDDDHVVRARVAVHAHPIEAPPDA